MMKQPLRLMLYALMLITAAPLYASTCTSNADCNEWGPKHCECGVHATCIGITEQNKSGYCQCYGAQGSCKTTSESIESTTNVIHHSPHRRTAPVRRNAVRENQGIESVEIERSR